MNSYLIDLNTLKSRGFINKNVENTVLNTVLERVQDTMLQPILGTSFFKRLVKGVKDNDLNADEIALLNDYILPFVVSSCDLKSVYPVLIEIRAKTVGKSGDQYITPLAQSDSVAYQDELRAYSDFYRLQLIGHLKDNRTKFPTYDQYECSRENIKPDCGGVKINIRFA